MDSYFQNQTDTVLYTTYILLDISYVYNTVCLSKEMQFFHKTAREKVFLLSRRSIFDTNRDGKLDSIEMAAGAAFLEELENKENENRAYQRKRSRKHVSNPTGISFLGKPIYDGHKDTGCLRLSIALVLLALPFPLMFLFDVEPQSWGVALCLLLPATLALLVLKNC